MTETFTQTAPDSTGVKLRGLTQTIGADLVHALPVVPQWGSTPPAQYAFGFTIAGSTTNAFAYLILWNPSGSGKVLVVRRFILESVSVSQVNLKNTTSAYNATGTAPSGGTLQPASAICKTDTTDPNPAAELRTNGPVLPGTLLADFRLNQGIQRPETAPGTRLATRMAERARTPVPQPPVAILREGFGIAWSNQGGSALDVDVQFFLALAWDEVAALP